MNEQEQRVAHFRAVLEKRSAMRAPVQFSAGALSARILARQEAQAQLDALIRLARRPGQYRIATSELRERRLARVVFTPEDGHSDDYFPEVPSVAISKEGDELGERFKAAIARHLVPAAESLEAERSKLGVIRPELRGALNDALRKLGRELI
ncbi:hypothetical protein DFO45_5004 [Azorhizobium sp. AG788]|uniref:hypothetical protein n=1 Tax=Azorhizobium sp. AG788 TaxID=2183897 RepID=UPI00106093B5|nr:hypothetical protein [Azorhizobium sp. AG788]TDT87330.1 hypothetical protein DFO45_5004 [Azorhizobium sp. AG788]